MKFNNKNGLKMMTFPAIKFSQPRNFKIFIINNYNNHLFKKKVSEINKIRKISNRVIKIHYNNQIHSRHLLIKH